MYAIALLQTLQKFKSLNLSAIINFNKFNNYTIVHHSTSIEGSTLTFIETQILIEEQITPKGKPILHSLMVQNNFEALQFVIANAKQKTPITLNLIQQINAKVMRQTGNVYQTVFGEVDASKGMLRKGNVSAGSTYFVNFSKVENLIKILVAKISESLSKPLTLIEQINLCFDIHFVVRNPKSKSPKFKRRKIQNSQILFELLNTLKTRRKMSQKITILRINLAILQKWKH